MARSLYAKLLKKFGTTPTGYEKNQYALRLQNEISPDVNRLLQAVPTTDGKFNVVIVGAGFAGLCAGYFLSERGHHVTIFEARDRVGGRVFSKNDFARGQIIEFGAELVGSNHPLWVKLAKGFGLSFNVVTGEDMFTGALLEEPLIIDDKPVSEEDAIKLTLNMGIVLDALTELSETVDCVFPWRSKDAVYLDGKSLSSWFYDKIGSMAIPAKEKALLYAALNAEYTNNNVVPMEKQSLLAVLAQIKAGGGENYWTMTEVYRCSSGNDELAKRMEQAIIAKGNRVEKNCPVNKIEVFDESVKVITAKGETKEAQYVILAIPPTVWKDIQMDAEIMNYRSQMGNAIKYMSALKNRFWIKQGVAPSGLCGPLGMTWEGSDNQIEIAGKQMDLSSFCGGTFADNILAQPDRDNYYKTKLNNIFEGYTGAVEKTHLQSWPEEQWTKTGYSFPNVGEVCTKIKMLNEQPYKNRMYFAGEHTSTGFCGYMEGALQSGQRVAISIDPPL